MAGWHTQSQDTIVAISSAPGAGWRGIVRLSGPAAWRLALGLLETGSLSGEPAAQRLLTARLGEAPLPVELLLFAAPRSYTGLDVAELHLPGAPALLRRVLHELGQAGARHADPGEFTAQAFFHGKMDLTEAEGVAATIAAGSARQLHAAAALRCGALHRWSERIAERLTELLARVEAGIDFSDEPGISFLGAAEANQQIATLRGEIENLLRDAVRWERTDALPTVVLTGRPNVGKSSLINALTGQQRAIVSPLAGTTRDALSAEMSTPRGPVRLVDVAGVESPTGEMQGRMQEARETALAGADLVLLVIDEQSGPRAVDAAHTELARTVGRRPLVIRNKCDLPDPPETAEVYRSAVFPWHPEGFFSVSAKTGEGLPALRRWISEELVRREHRHAAELTINARHRAALATAQEALGQALANATDDSVTNFPELLASDLRAALDALGQMTGVIAPDEILGRIFATFCVGK